MDLLLLLQQHKVKLLLISSLNHCIFREEEEAAQRALSGEAETTEEMDIPEGGNPFKPLHLSQFAEERVSYPLCLLMKIFFFLN